MGEENAGLTRMSRGEDKSVKLKKNDIVVLSSSIIPGYERRVLPMVDDIMRSGPYVYQDYTREIDQIGVLHVGGHGHTEEIEKMIQIVKPQYFVPAHGEYHFLVRGAKLARRAGLAENQILVVENGQSMIADKSGKFRLGPKVQAGAVLIDGSGIGDVQTIVLKDRLSLASDGIFVAIATVHKKTGKLATSPDIISRGFVYMKGNEKLIAKARKIIKDIFEKRDVFIPANSPIIKTRMRDELSNFLYKATKRNPIIIPVVIEA